MEFSEVLRELEAREPWRMEPGLERIRALVELLDHPEETYDSIHVTGTNGKTTTSRLAARIICAHGFAAGLYTSPHLHSVTERISLCDQPISEDEFVAVYEHLRPYVQEVDRRGDPLTYFEVLTALAFLWCADKPVKVGVFEVGMGGTWDATNLILGDVAAFSRISLDHPELGASVEEIAGTKAGIVKPGSTVVTQEQAPEVLATIEARAADMEAPVLLEGRDFALEGRATAVGGQAFRLRGVHATYDDLFLPILGEHQAHNAALAIAACEALLATALNPPALRSALEGATSPGRLEVVARHPLVILDGAHNPDAARVLAEALRDSFTWVRLHLVIGVLDTKDVDGVLALLAPLVSEVYPCASSSPHALPAEAMVEACLRAGLKGDGHLTVAEALDAARAAAAPTDLIAVTGSLYTVADARPRFVH